jgi:hypothetical protein
MPRMKTATASTRLAWAALLALLLAIRVVATCGYMPMVEHGRMALMLCPDGEWTAPAVAMPGMGKMGDQGPKQAHHQQCPYAVAAAIPFASGNSSALPVLPALLFLLIGASVFSSLVCRTPFERPFSTGPPIPA